MKKIVIGGGVSICLLLGMMILCDYKEIKQEGRLIKDNLYESENQNGYPMSNFGVSITNGENMDSTEVLEFVIENGSDKKWYWRNYIEFNKEREGYTSDLEVKIDETWYNVPLKEEYSNNMSISLMKLHLLPESTTTISVYTNVYQTLVAGKYRFTITVYDDNNNEFNLSREVTITEEE